MLKYFYLHFLPAILLFTYGYCCSSKSKIDTPTTLSFSEIPIPIISFGDISRVTVPNTSPPNADKIVVGVMKLGSKVLAKAVPYAGFMLTVLSTLLEQCKDVRDQLNSKLNDVERRVFTTQIDGALNTLRQVQLNLGHENTTEVQIVSELTVAVAEFNRILPVFTNKENVLYRKYFLGAPLFVQLCGMLKIILTIANKVPGYNNAYLPALEMSYKNRLENYKLRCIRARVAGVFALRRAVDTVYSQKTVIWDFQDFPEYFCKASNGGYNCNHLKTLTEEFSKLSQWNKADYLEYYNKQVTGEDEYFIPRLSLNLKAPGVYDAWDVRKASEKVYEGSVSIPNDPNEWKMQLDINLMKKAIKYYQSKLIILMEEYFQIL